MPSRPKPTAPSLEPYQAMVDGPMFSLGLRCSPDEIISIEYLPPRPTSAPEIPPTIPLAAEAVRQLRAYLENPTYQFGLPLRPSGTPFQRRVWEAIATIPGGQTRSYGELAKSIHNAPRAVGQACGANPFPLVIPCHRVIAAGGALGGFSREKDGFLLDVKRWLLRHEGIQL